jgi:hypothetical protein
VHILYQVHVLALQLAQHLLSLHMPCTSTRGGHSAKKKKKKRTRGRQKNRRPLWQIGPRSEAKKERATWCVISYIGMWLACEQARARRKPQAATRGRQPPAASRQPPALPTCDCDLRQRQPQPPTSNTKTKAGDPRGLQNCFGGWRWLGAGAGRRSAVSCLLRLAAYGPWWHVVVVVGGGWVAGRCSRALQQAQ